MVRKRIKWWVKRADYDPETEPPKPARNLAHAVLLAKCIDDRFRLGTKHPDGFYQCYRSGIVIEQAKELEPIYFLDLWTPQPARDL